MSRKFTTPDPAPLSALLRACPRADEHADALNYLAAAEPLAPGLIVASGAVLAGAPCAAIHNLARALAAERLTTAAGWLDALDELHEAARDGAVRSAGGVR